MTSVTYFRILPAVVENVKTLQKVTSLGHGGKKVAAYNLPLLVVFDDDC